MELVKVFNLKISIKQAVSLKRLSETDSFAKEEAYRILTEEKQAKVKIHSLRINSFFEKKTSEEEKEEKILRALKLLEEFDLKKEVV